MGEDGLPMDAMTWHRTLRVTDAVQDCVRLLGLSVSVSRLYHACPQALPELRNTCDAFHWRRED